MSNTVMVTRTKATPRQTQTGDVVTFLGEEIITTREFLNGQSLPNYKSIIRAGGDATTSLQAGRNTFKYTPGYAHGTGVNGNNQTIPWSSSYQGLDFLPIGGGPAVPQDLVLQSQAAARSRAFKKLYEFQTDFNGQIILAELNQTLALLRNPLKSMIALTTELKSLSRRSKKMVPKEIANSWLAYRFGVLPLISDVASIIKLANSLDAKKKLAYRTYGMAESSTSEPWRNIINSFVTGYGTTTVKYKAETIIHFGINLEMLTPPVSLSGRFLNTADDLKSLPITAWEMIPWSFLVDYFVNIGDIVQAVSQGNSLLSFSSESLIRSQIIDGRVYAIQPNDERVKVMLAKPTSYSYNLREVTRVKGPLGIPPVVFSLPGTKVRLGNMAALLTKFI